MFCHTWNLYYSRLDHASLPHVKNVVFRSLLGFVSSSPSDFMSCQLGKQPVLPFNKSESIALAPFNLTHLNIWESSLIAMVIYYICRFFLVIYMDLFNKESF